MVPTSIPLPGGGSIGAKSGTACDLETVATNLLGPAQSARLRSSTGSVPSTTTTTRAFRSTSGGRPGGAGSVPSAATRWSWSRPSSTATSARPSSFWRISSGCRHPGMRSEVRRYAVQEFGPSDLGPRSPGSVKLGSSRRRNHPACLWRLRQPSWAVAQLALWKPGGEAALSPFARPWP